MRKSEYGTAPAAAARRVGPSWHGYGGSEALSYSPSSVSVGLHELEREAGATLSIRTGRLGTAAPVWTRSFATAATCWAATNPRCGTAATRGTYWVRSSPPAWPCRCSRCCSPTPSRKSPPARWLRIACNARSSPLSAPPATHRPCTPSAARSAKPTIHRRWAHRDRRRRLTRATALAGVAASDD